MQLIANTYAVDTGGAVATVNVATVVLFGAVSVSGTGKLLAPTLCAVQDILPLVFGDAVTVTVNKVPVVVAVPVVMLATRRLLEDPVAGDTVGDVPAAAPAVIVGGPNPLTA